MRKIILLAITFITISSASAQDFSNKGKDFWVGYGYHQVMTAGNGQNMVLYFATDVASVVTVSIPGLAYSQTYNIAANTIFTTPTMPKGPGQDARLNTSGLLDKGIHITSDFPIVAYAHIYNSSVSGATVLLPTNTLGKEYSSINYTNNSNVGNSNCWFYVIATEPGTTDVEITPSAAAIGHPAGVPFTVTLQQGQVYNVMGTLPFPNSGTDLTGSKVKSVAAGNVCKRIAVFSGSGRIFINCGSGGTSSDNYMVQSFPKTAWGKKYLTVPTGGAMTRNIYRVCVSDPAAKVTINGVFTTLPLINGFYYEIPATNIPQLIESDLAITVAQYITTQNSCGNGTPGDPEVIYLSSVEQNIKNVLFNSNLLVNPVPPSLPHQHYVNAVIPNGGTALSSFRIDGVLPPVSFTVHPQDPSYSYIQIPNLTLGQHTLVSDSGFNAIAYGFATTESYGYNAGTNVRDLSQQLEIGTTYGIETSPSVCTNSPFKFKLYFPDSTLTTPPVAIRFDSLKWNLSNTSIVVPNNFPIMNTPPTIDSTNIRNGRQVNWYSLPTTYYFNAAGIDTLLVTGYTSTNEGCGSNREYEFPIQISNPPTASFIYTPGGCVAEPYIFTETTPQFPKATYRFYWDFGDGNFSFVRNPQHTYSTPGNYIVRHASITTPGCLSDTIQQTIVVPDYPNAIIAGNTTVCINSTPDPIIIFTGSLGTAPYTFYYNINSVAQPPLNTVSGNTASVTAPTNTAGTFVYTLDSVKNTGSTACVRNITGQTVTINITPDATVTLRAGDNDNQTVCIDSAIAPIRYDIGGSGTSGSVIGLPAGVAGTYAAGVVTITGNPTISGVFPYTVNTDGPCFKPQATGTITVTANATITLTSAAGSDNQTLCINTLLLVNITYAVGGTGTGGSVTGLPAGVTGTFSGGTVTITGTPTVSGVFPYTVLTTGPCVIPTANGTITVTADGTLTLTSAAGTDNQSRCINVAITNITYAISGSATGASVSGLPAGVTWVFAGGIVTISGAPTTTVGSPFMYTVTTTGPCVAPQLSGTITVNPDASITLTSAPPTTSQALCRNSTITDITYAVAGGGTNATVSGLPAGVTGVYAGGIVTISGAPTIAGTFSYTVNTTGTCIQASATGTITVHQLPTANFLNSAPTCETRTISFTDLSVGNTGTVSAWSWNFGDGSPLDLTQNPTHVYAGAGTYNVTLTVTTAAPYGCVSNPIANIPVTINDRPVAGFIIPEVCLSDTYAQFIDTSTLAVGVIDNWRWNFGDPGSGPLNTSILKNPTHSYSAVGNYDVELIVWRSATNCRDTILQTLVVNGSNPYAIFNVNNPTTLCANDSVAIVEASTVFPGVITKIEIYWDNVNFPAVFDIDNSPFTGKVYRHLYPNFQTPLTRVFQIRYRAYSGGVCVDDTLRNITVNAAPLVQFNNMPDTCLLASPFQITQASEIGGVPGSGVFSGPGVSSSGIFTPMTAGIGLHTILYTFTSTVGGCVDTMSNTIRVLDTANAAFTFVSPSCEQTPTSFTDVSTAPATVTLSNTVWNFGDGSPVENHAPGSTFTHSFPAPGTYTVTMYNVSAYGCNSTITSQQVTIDPNHTITLTTANDNQTVCINNPITDIVYTLSGGANNATVTGLPAGLTATVTGGTTLTIRGTPTSTVGSPFMYTVLTTGNSCLIADTTGIITVNPDHTIAFVSGDTTQSVCVNSPIDPIVYTIGGGANNVTIGNLPPGVTGTVAGNILTISGTPTTTAGGPLFTYTIQTTGNTCIKANAAGEIRVSPYPVPNFTVDKLSYCIPNAIVGFIQGSTMPDGSSMTFTWNFGDGSPTVNSFNASHWYSSQGPFNVNLIARSTVLLNGNVTGCAHDTTIVLNTIHPQPKADFVFNKPSVCIGDNVTITDNTDGKDGIVNQWSWNLGDGTTRVTNPVTHTYGDTITYNITMFSVNSHGCNSDTVTKPYTVYPYPRVNAGPDKFVLEGGSVLLEAVTFANDPQYVWTPNLYLNDNRIARPRVIDPKTDMTYRLTVTGRGGCALSDEVFVKLLKFPAIPNTFTPNNDGINDTWRIDYLHTYPNNRVQVFTRAGNLVFESRGYTTPWDGTMKGKPMPFDTYYYIIEPGNGRDPITGYVTIIK